MMSGRARGAAIPTTGTIMWRPSHHGRMIRGPTVADVSLRARLGIVRIYLSAFADPRHWTTEDHEAGLVAVYQAGAEAERRRNPEPDDSGSDHA